jgi:DNA-directed RNA polymerase subunit H (RpoH/RPB5)
LSATDIVIDLGGVSVTAGEMIEIIREEKRKLLEKYGITSELDIPRLLQTGMVTVDEAMEIERRLRILDEMEDAVYEEINIRRGAVRLPVAKLIREFRRLIRI